MLISVVSGMWEYLCALYVCFFFKEVDYMTSLESGVLEDSLTLLSKIQKLLLYYDWLECCACASGHW